MYSKLPIPITNDIALNLTVTKFFKDPADNNFFSTISLSYPSKDKSVLETQNTKELFILSFENCKPVSRLGPNATFQHPKYTFLIRTNGKHISKLLRFSIRPDSIIHTNPDENPIPEISELNQYLNIKMKGSVVCIGETRIHIPLSDFDFYKETKLHDINNLFTKFIEFSTIKVEQDSNNLFLYD